MRIENIYKTLKSLPREKVKSFYDFLSTKPEFIETKRVELPQMLKQFAECKPNSRSYYKRTTLPLYFEQWNNEGRVQLTHKQITILEYTKKLSEVWNARDIQRA